MRPPFCGKILSEKMERIFVSPLYKSGKACYNMWADKACTGGSMDRASDSGSEGWGFESLPAYQLTGYPIRDILFNFL